MSTTISSQPTEQSKQLFESAQRYLPGGVNSPVRAFKAVGGTPRFIHSAKGAELIDEDGNHYIDYVGSWGPMVLGHNHPHVVAAVQQALTNGLSFGAPCRKEVELAQKVCELMPHIEKIRFVNSGTEATMSAIRLARGATGRDKMIKFEGCYHGHADHLLVKAGSGALTFGTPTSPGITAHNASDTLVAQFNRLDSVSELFEQNPGEIACVILEPISGNMNMIMPDRDFLAGLRDICNQNGALLIFDEVMTGFRVGLGGAQALFDIKPDITTLGKVIGGGMPVGAYGASNDLMEQMAPNGPVYQAGTLSGNPIAMSAGLATLELIAQPGFYDQLTQQTAKLVNGLQQLADQQQIPFSTQHAGGMFGLFFSEQRPSYFEQVCGSDIQRFTAFFNSMLEQGIYLAPSAFEAGFVSIMHNDQLIEKTLLCAERAFKL